jgi:hypothetical protein
MKSPFIRPEFQTPPTTRVAAAGPARQLFGMVGRLRLKDGDDGGDQGEAVPAQARPAGGALPVGPVASNESSGPVESALTQAPNWRTTQ